MPEQEFEQKALDAANRILGKFLAARNRRDYHYFEAPDERMFCYTPWKDENGYYSTWVMRPHGRGARSGKATKWKRVGKVVLSRTRKTARKRAYTRYQNWLAYLRQDWRE